MKSENSICVLSDVHFDQPKCMDRLMRLVEGFKIAPPMAFVLCGDFLEKPHAEDAFETMKRNLTNSPRKCSRPTWNSRSLFLSRGHRIQVPKKTKQTFIWPRFLSGLADCLPRPAIPSALISPFIKQRLPNWRFVSNPARLTLFSQEVFSDFGWNFRTSN